MKNLELWDACGNRVIIAQKENMDLMTSLSISFKNEVAALLQTYKADTMMLCSTDGKVVRVLESDLSESNMCGNGIRAVHKYFTGLNHVYLTLAGKVECHLLNDGNVSVKMGRVNLHGQIKYKGFNLYLSDVGEPHAVLLVDDIA